MKVLEIICGQKCIRVTISDYSYNHRRFEDAGEMTDDCISEWLWNYCTSRRTNSERNTKLLIMCVMDGGMNQV
jgi:hypothetical protein